jgi:IS30 family transposase
MIRWLALEAAMGERHSHLSLEERRLIDAMWEASIPVCQIAKRLGRHRGTIHRELNRNFYHTSFRDRFGNDYRGYYGMTANAMAGRRRRRGRVKLLRCPALLAHVVERLQAGWSPQQVSGRLKIEPEPVGRISHESIYRHFYSPEGREAKLYALLAVARRHRRRAGPR